MTNTIYGHWPGNSPLNVSRETNKQLTDGARGRTVKNEDADLFSPANTDWSGAVRQLGSII